MSSGPLFHRARLKLGLKQADIARIFRINESTIHRWERQIDLKVDPLHALLIQHLVWLAAAPDPLFFRDFLQWAGKRDHGFGLFVMLKIAFDDFGDEAEEHSRYAENITKWAVANGFKKDESQTE